MKENRSKHSLIKLSLLLISVMIVGATVWYLWHINRSSAVNESSQPQVSTSPNKDADTTVMSDAQPISYEPKPLVTDFSIKELGLTFKIAQDLNKLTYAVIDKNNIGFSYDGWEAIDTNCSATKAAAGILSVYESSSLSSDIQPDNTVGNYSYVYTAPQAPCSSNVQIMKDQTSTQPGINLKNSIQKSLKSL